MLCIKSEKLRIENDELCSGKGYCYQNTLLRTSGAEFIDDPEGMQTEIFGNGGLFVVCDDEAQMAEVCTHFEGPWLCAKTDGLCAGHDRMVLKMMDFGV